MIPPQGIRKNAEALPAKREDRKADVPSATIVPGGVRDSASPEMSGSYVGRRARAAGKNVVKRTTGRLNLQRRASPARAATSIVPAACCSTQGDAPAAYLSRCVETAAGSHVYR
jgi:hypothetical protein